uniref:Sushi domain-containing protein n=1 Tax=Pavo cristatus TaxID=9049 RepID=A0A8C9EZG8_PAVCR
GANGDVSVPGRLQPAGAPVLPNSACFLLVGGCGVPTRLTFAELNEEHRNEIDFSVGKTVGYTCRPGFAKHPGMSPTITCLQSGVWSEALEFCKTGCRAPPRLVFAELKEPYRNQTAFPVGGIVEYVCQPGYARHVGMSPTVTCLRNQSWSVAPEFCKSASCVGGSMDAFPYAAVVTYTCEPGRVLAGTASIFCTSVDGGRGAWSGPPPRCGEVQCPPPPSIANGKHSSQPSDTFLPGAAVQYTCKDGYLLTGNASITCTAEGTWSQPRPRCEGMSVLAAWHRGRPFPLGSGFNHYSPNPHRGTVAGQKWRQKMGVGRVESYPNFGTFRYLGTANGEERNSNAASLHWG